GPAPEPIVAETGRPAAAVELVPDHGMPDVREVDADLMGPAGLDADPQERQGPEHALDPVMRDRGAGTRGARRDLAPVPGIASDRDVDRPRRGPRSAEDQGHVLLAYLAAAELSGQCPVRR